MGDLLPDGKIRSVETDLIFASPSAWAIHCKRIINPDKKSGCGWASVKYKGRKLDACKNEYFFKKKPFTKNKENEPQPENKNKDNDHHSDADEEMELKPPASTILPPTPAATPTPQLTLVRPVVKHNMLGNRSTLHDPNTLVESVPFSVMGKIQPFLVSMSTNAALVMDFHCHLTTSEVVGYLAGHWDVNAHNLAITHVFPCRSRLSDREMAPLVEQEIQKAMEARRLTLVGWYHSHPSSPATPTLRDIDTQLDYEIIMRGGNDASYTPCVGVICSPYNKDSLSLESTVVSYWVAPPPENKPHEYGKPMLMSYSVIQDQYLTQDTLNEMKKCADYYKGDPDVVKFGEKYKGNVTYLDKLKTTLTSKFPRDQSDGKLWAYLSELVMPGSTGETSPPSVPASPSPTPSPSTSSATSSASALGLNIPKAGASLFSAEIANALFSAGKFPTPASLMGLSALFPTPLPPSLLKYPSPSKLLDKNYTLTSGHS
ncbi:MPN domain-containing protein-like isoform X2 [Macrosteles quadrilineatus]|nr:MPN domain-containing protein-like isoform X2 [Macrosteles quadrilineatus]